MTTTAGLVVAHVLGRPINLLCSRHGCLVVTLVTLLFSGAQYQAIRETELRCMEDERALQRELKTLQWQERRVEQYIVMVLANSGHTTVNGARCVATGAGGLEGDCNRKELHCAASGTRTLQWELKHCNGRR